MPTCFVIQPFDGGPFDKRYEDVFVLNSSLFPAALESPRGFTREPKVITTE